MLESQTMLAVKTPLPECPFNSDSISEAFMAIVSAEPRSPEAGFLKDNTEMVFAAFSWNNQGSYASSFTFIWDVKNNIFISPVLVKKAIETHFDDPEVNGDAHKVEYIFNGIQLIVTIKHKF